MLHYKTYRSYIKERFGKPVLKIPLNAGFSCPNRDGTLSTQGCSFCDNQSFSPVAHTSLSVIDQLGYAITRDHKKHQAFIAYLQPFSNTYGDIDKLKQCYESLITYPQVIGLALGTRPDCFTIQTFDYLADVAKRTYLSVELGLQSSNNATLAKNTRGHTAEDFSQAVIELHKRNIETVAHVMIGLPPDAHEQIKQTAQFVAALPIHGIKIHQLMIIKGTQLHEWFTQGTINPITLEEYANDVCEFISYIRPDQYIHRIMADSTIENGLIAPLWSAEKQNSMAYIQDIMDKRGLMQGSHYSDCSCSFDE